MQVVYNFLSFFFPCLNFQHHVAHSGALLSMKLFIKHSVFRFVVTALAASLSQKWWVLIKLLTEDSKFLDGRAVLYHVFVWHLRESESKSGFLSF